MKPVLLWSVPRSLSTVFERAVMNLSELTVFHEPYTTAYYFGPQRVSARYADHAPDPQHAYEAVTATVLRASRSGRVFVKDMAYAAAGKLGDDTLQQFQHTFLIRDPRRSIPSLYGLSVDRERTGWDHFDPAEAGFVQALEILRWAKRHDPGSTLVIDAADLIADPAGVLRRYCEATGLTYTERMLTWPRARPEQWRTWAPWHEHAMTSTGFEARPPSAPPETSTLPDVVQQSVRESLAAYEEMLRLRS